MLVEIAEGVRVDDGRAVDAGHLLDEERADGVIATGRIVGNHLIRAQIVHLHVVDAQRDHVGGQLVVERVARGGRQRHVVLEPGDARLRLARDLAHEQGALALLQLHVRQRHDHFGRHEAFTVEAAAGLCRRNRIARSIQVLERLRIDHGCAVDVGRRLDEHLTRGLIAAALVLGAHRVDGRVVELRVAYLERDHARGHVEGGGGARGGGQRQLVLEPGETRLRVALKQLAEECDRLRLIDRLVHLERYDEARRLVVVRRALALFGRRRRRHAVQTVWHWCRRWRRRRRRRRRRCGQFQVGRGLHEADGVLGQSRVRALIVAFRRMYGESGNASRWIIRRAIYSFC